MDIANISKLEQTDSAKSRWIFLMGKTKSRNGQPAHTHKPTEQHFIGLPGKSRWSCSFTLQKQLEQKSPRKTTTVHIEFSHLRSENKTSAQTPISFQSCMPLQRVSYAEISKCFSCSQTRIRLAAGLCVQVRDAFESTAMNISSIVFTRNPP